MTTPVERLTECSDTLQRMIKLATSHGVSPMLLRATSREICATATAPFCTELSLRNQSALYYEDLCNEVLKFIPRDVSSTFFVDGVEIYVSDWSSVWDE